MNPVFQSLASESWTQFVQSLLHTLWIGAIVAGLLYLLLRRVANPEARYRWSIAALGTVLLGGLICWSVLQEKSPRHFTTVTAAETSQPSTTLSTAFANGELEKGSLRAIFRQESPVISKLAFRRWIPWLALAWICGTILMVGKTIWLVGNAERVRRTSRPLENQTLLELIQRAQAQLQLAKKIQVAVTEELTSPAVLGIFVPMLVLPLSLVTTLPMNQLQLIVLHELAHIRRGDYFVNLCQLLAESVLFFNPAAWWISRQIRQEREACCDALAIALAGGRVEYARTLVQIAEEVLGTAPAAGLAFGGDHKRSSLRDRISRLLVPGYKPTVHLTRRAMMMWLILGGAFLFLSAMGTRWTVSAAAHLLSPKERIEHIEQKMTAYGEPPKKESESDEKRRVKVAVKLRTKDGSSLPKDMRASFDVRQTARSSTCSASWVDKNGIARDDVPQGDMTFVAWSEEWPPTYIGPIDIRGKTEVNDLELVMDPGFPISTEVVDEETRQPLAGGSVSYNFWLPTGSSSFPPRIVMTDASGVARLPQCAKLQIEVTVEKPGYETEKRKFDAPQPDQQLKVSLRHALPTTGVIAEKNSGKPIQGATLYVLESKGPNPVPGSELKYPGPALATSDKQGRFTITQLRRDLRYVLAVKAAQHEHVILYDVRSGQQNLRVELGPELIVRGKIIGGLAALEEQKGRYGRKLAFHWSYYTKPDSIRGEMTEAAISKIENGVAWFQLTNPIAGPVSIDLGGHEFQREIKTPVNDWEINLTAAAEKAAAIKTRKVILKFAHSSGVPPKGTIHVHLPVKDENGQTQKEFEIVNGQVEFDVPVGGNFGYSPFKTVGYWFKEDYRVEVPDEPSPLLVSVPIVPAGAIYAHVRNPDGSLARDASCSVREVKKSPVQMDPNSWFNNGYSQNDPKKFVASPVPLGGEYAVLAHRKNGFAISARVALTEEKPEQEVEVKFGETRDFTGRVLSPDGKPLRAATIEMTWQLSDGGWGLSPTLTDEDGKFRFEDCTDAVGEYRLTVSSPGLRAVFATVNWKKLPLEIRLEHGLKLAGQFVEAKSGLPIVGADARLYPKNGKVPSAMVKTDDEGRFEFTTLSDTDYWLYLNGANYKAGQMNEFRPGQTKPLVLEMVPYEGSRIRLGAKK